MTCKFVFNSTRSKKLASDPTFKGFMIAGEDISLSFHAKKTLELNQSYAVGFAVLELSKYHMFHLFYHKVKPLLDCPVSVLFSDTDSFLLLVKESDSDKVVSALKEVMDFSNYPPTHPLFDPSRKNICGYLKNEVSHEEIQHFVGIRAKTYAIKTRKEGMEMNRAKGVKQAFKRKIPFESYLKCIEGLHSESVTQYTMGAKNHQNMMFKSTKVAFSSFDDKRFLLCPRHSVPYGSDLIRQSKELNQCIFCHRGHAYDDKSLTIIP